MKMRFYVDMYPGCDPKRYSVSAHTSPSAKTPGWRRVAFDVEIPDSVLYQIDAVSPEVGKVEVV